MCARIAQPLVMTQLKKLGYIKDSIKLVPFNPSADWQMSYSILSCKGVMPSKPQHCGTLKIRKKTDSGITFTVEQQLADENLCFKVLIVNECLDDKMRTPVKYNSLSDFSGELSGQESFQYEKPNLSITVNGFLRTKKVTSPVTKWALIDIVQNLGFRDNEPLDFTFIESADIYKLHHSLRFHDKVFFDNAEGDKLPLYSYVQLGEGILPTEYWVDGNHRLLAIINSGRMYVLDDLVVKS